MTRQELALEGVALLFVVAVMLALLGHVARGQTPANIVRPWDGLTVHASWPSSTTRIECETPGLPAGGVGALTGETDVAPPIDVTFPLSFPALEVRCRACNAVGCSAISPNALEISARKRGDCNGDGRVSVSDFLCVNQAIFAGG